MSISEDDRLLLIELRILVDICSLVSFLISVADWLIEASRLSTALFNDNCKLSTELFVLFILLL